MKITDFEQYIDKTILQRGAGYFAMDVVDSLEELRTNEWEADVMGSDYYHVTVNLGDELSIKSSGCDCPYDWGVVCKHEVAVFYALREHLQQNRKLEVTQSTNKPSKRKAPRTKQDKIAAILKQLSHEELKNFVEKSLLLNKPYYDQFMIRFSYLLADKERPKTRYKKIIDRIIKDHGDRYGFIEYSSSYAFSNEIDQVELQARAAAEHDPEEAIEAGLVLIKAMQKVVEMMDDSGGISGAIMYSACALIQDFYDELTEQDQQQTFNRLTAMMNEFGYDDYGLEEELDTLSVKMADAYPDRQKTMLDALTAEYDKKEGNHWRAEYLLRRRVDLLKRWNHLDEVESVINDHLHIVSFREQRVEQAIANEQFDQARQLIKEGLELAVKQHHHGTVNSWKQKLLDIAERTHDTDEIIQFNRQLFLSSHYERVYYQTLKQHIPKEQWEVYYKELIEEIPPRDYEAKAVIYNTEKNWAELMKLVQESRSISMIRGWGKELSEHYPAEILQLYQMAIEQEAKKTGRAVYQEVVEFLQELSQLTMGKEIARRLIEKFRNQYKNRPAMMEMLNTAFGKAD